MCNFTISLKAARINAELPLSYVAERLGKTRQCVSNWETGKACIKAVDLDELCRLYKIPMECIRLP